MKPETIFRNRVVLPFLKKLPRCDITSVQQLARSGDPDLLICLCGRFIAIELKARKGAKISKLQIWKLNKITDAGGISLVVYPENWQDTKNILTQLSTAGSLA